MFLLLTHNATDVSVLDTVPGTVLCRQSASNVEVLTQPTLPQKVNLGINKKDEQHKQQVKCANCDGNHTANYRGCPGRKNYLEVLEKQRKNSATSQPPRPTSTAQQPTGERPAPPGWGRTYASVAAPGKSTSASPVVGAEDDGFTLTEFLGLARGLFTSFREHRSKEQQFWALTDLMGKYLSK